MVVSGSAAVRVCVMVVSGNGAVRVCVMGL
jgi:hypothetical protein